MNRLMQNANFTAVAASCNTSFNFRLRSQVVPKLGGQTHSKMNGNK